MQIGSVIQVYQGDAKQAENERFEIKDLYEFKPKRCQKVEQVCRVYNSYKASVGSTLINQSTLSQLASTATLWQKRERAGKAKLVWSVKRIFHHTFDSSVSRSRQHEPAQTTTKGSSI